MSLKVVCTGGSGTIGQFLPESVVRLRTRLEESTTARMSELRSLAPGPFSFLHLAALTSVAQAEKDPARARLLNVDGSVKWLRAAAEVGCRRFVYVSTSHVFKPTPTREFLAPDRPSDATAVYGHTKAEAEVALLAAGSGIEVVIARVFSVTSPQMRDGFLYPELLRRAREKDFKPLPGYQNVRDFVDAQSVADQLMWLATAPSLERQTYHIGSGVPKSVRELAEDVMDTQGISRDEIISMFPPVSEPANYLISEPSKIGEHR